MMMTYQAYWLVGPVLALLFPVTWTRVLPGEVSCDWWRAGHVTTVLTSHWSGCLRDERLRSLLNSGSDGWKK